MIEQNDQKKLYEGRMGILRTSDGLANLGTFYPRNTDVLEQYVENGYDAGAKQIIVVLEKNRIAIFDDGRGFVPNMLSEDYETLQMYKEDINNQKMSEDIPLDVLFPELSKSPSLSSFQWMMECIGLSSKKFTRETGARGIKGLGALSYQQIANRASWYSKPTPDLALAYYKDKGIAQNPPTVMLRSATVDELRRQILRYELSQSEPLQNPYLREEVESGTLVELTELREGVERSLRPNRVVESLRERFGNDIRNGRLKIQVIDSITNEKDPIMIEVPPATYPGILIYHRESALSTGRGPFEVELHYDHLGHNLYPKLVRKGSEVCRINQLPDFDRHPWNIGRLSGIISYPDLSDDESPWDAQKSLPLPGPVYNQWQKRVCGMSEEIESEIKRIDEQYKLGQLEEFSKLLGKEAIEAMKEIPDFQDIVFGSKKEGPKRGTPKQEDKVIIKVINEHDDGVTGARIELQKPANNELLKAVITKRSGTVSLGRYPSGRYRVRLAEIPVGTIIDGMSQYIFNLGPNQLGIRETFHVVNGEPKRPRQKPLNQINPFFHGWEDPPEEPYNQRLEYGVVEINTEGSALRDAIARNDQEARTILCAQYIASAVAEYVAAEDENKGEILKNASRLFGALSRRLMSRRRRS
ncbi:MAG: hypothetical protein V1808_00380 [Candidatus Daviesbacteria bacterium]